MNTMWLSCDRLTVKVRYGVIIHFMPRIVQLGYPTLPSQLHICVVSNFWSIGWLEGMQNYTEFKHTGLLIVTQLRDVFRRLWHSNWWRLFFFQLNDKEKKWSGHVRLGKDCYFNSCKRSPSIKKLYIINQIKVTYHFPCY